MMKAPEDFVYVRHWISRSEHPDIRHRGFIGYCQVPQGIIKRDLQVSSRKISWHHSCQGEKLNKHSKQANLWASLERSCGGVIELMVLPSLPAHPLRPDNNFRLKFCNIFRLNFPTFLVKVCKKISKTLQHLWIKLFFGLQWASLFSLPVLFWCLSTLMRSTNGRFPTHNAFHLNTLVPSLKCRILLSLDTLSHL